MSGSPDGGLSDRAGRVRRVGLALVMGGALPVSVRGQVEAVLALPNDLAACWP